jgi:hypothetical protein
VVNHLRKSLIPDQQTIVVSTDPIEAIKNWAKKIPSLEDRELYLQYAKETIEKLKK